MNVKIIRTDDNFLILEYKPRVTKIKEKLFNNNENLKIKWTFYFFKEDLIDLNYDNLKFAFKLWTPDWKYIKIKKEILDLKYDLLLDSSMELKLQTFLIDSWISIFKEIDRLVKQQIIVWGDIEESIPIEEFLNLIKHFPNTTELKHYRDTKITHYISEYFDTTKDAELSFEKYLARKNKQIPEIQSIESVNKYEYQKYSYILEKLNKMLELSSGYSEKCWEREILEIILIIFPKYIECFHSIHVDDYYSKPTKIDRQIDIVLVDVNNNIDIIEIKKPELDSIISKSPYRDNHFPKKELSWTIMQVEKYLFHLNKWWVKWEKVLKGKLMIDIKITNPKWLLILWRDKNFSDSQRFDFEIIRRKYSNIMDIITYDDLIRRLENILKKFR